MKSVSIYILSITVLLISCQEQKPGQVPVTEDYADQVEEWKQSRIESLTEPTCQLPPVQNRLDIAITDGEKRPVEWQGL